MSHFQERAVVIERPANQIVRYPILSTVSQDRGNERVRRARFPVAPRL